MDVSRQREESRKSEKRQTGAMEENPQSCLCSYETALAAYRADPTNYSGLMFYLTKDVPFCVVDLDKVLTPPDDPNDVPIMEMQAAKILHFANTLTEKSISGRGLHIIGKAHVDNLVSSPYTDVV